MCHQAAWSKLLLARGLSAAREDGDQTAEVQIQTLLMNPKGLLSYWTLTAGQPGPKLTLGICLFRLSCGKFYRSDRIP